jgi:inner membrane protein
MDSITHLALGACTGELILGRKLGKKAMLWGAIAANIPDMDIIAGLFVPGDESLVLHRGITHSLFFALVFGLILALFAKRFRPKIGFLVLAFFFCFELALHDLLDTCTSYGTGLLEPFSHARYSIHLLYVVDPLFTISLVAGSIYLIFGTRYRQRWAAIAMLISAFYLLFAGFSKFDIDNKTNASLTTPAPFTSMLWFCINKTDSGYYTGYSSIFDKRPISYSFHHQNDSLLTRPEPYLKTFAEGYYTVSQSNGRLYFNVLRFGQVQGWQNKNAPFALSYPLGGSGNETMVIQKGRLAGWNRHSIKQYLERIGGK